MKYTKKKSIFYFLNGGLSDVYLFCLNYTKSLETVKKNCFKTLIGCSIFFYWLCRKEVDDFIAK